MPKPTITVFTATYNRAHTLRRPWASLCSQTSKDFEWVIADGGSTDGTLGLLHELAQQSPFPVRILAFKERRGKPHDTNVAVQAAAGDLFVHLDSDDEFLPGAIDAIRRAWQEARDQREVISGIAGRSQFPDGTLGGPPFRANPLDMSWQEMQFREGRDDAICYAIRTDLLQQHPFPAVDFVVPEGATFIEIGRRHPTRFIDDVLLVYHLGTSGSVMTEPMMRFNRGHAKAMAIYLDAALGFFWRRPGFYLRGLVNYSRWNLHAGVGLKPLTEDIKPPIARIGIWLALPLAYGLAALDRRRAIVKDTHDEFLERAHRGMPCRCLEASTGVSPRSSLAGAGGNR